MKYFNRKLNTYLDEGHGSCALSNPRCQQIVVQGWRHFDGQRYELGDLVVMPNHVHLLVTPLPGYELEDILQSCKSHSAREINALCQRSGEFWQKHSYDHIVRNETEHTAYQRYIAENPIKARLAASHFTHRTATSPSS